MRASFNRRNLAGTTRMRVCVLTNILPPYRIGFYNELGRLCDLHVVLDSWWGDRPDDLREFGDDLDALRAMVALAATPTGFTAEDWPQQNDWRHPWGHKWWTTLVSDRLGDVGEGVRVRTMLGSVLRDRVMTHPSAAVIDECLTGLTDVLAAVPPERFAQLPRAEERYVIRPGGDEWRGLFDLLVWEVVLSGLFRSSPDTFTPEQVGTWWRLRRLIDEPYPGVRRDRVPDALTLRAHVAGEAPDDDADDMLFKPGYQLFSSWTRRQRDLLAQQYPAAVLLADRMRERAVELERTRGDLRTHATELAARVQYIEGVSIVVDLLDRFGPGALVRGYADPASRNGSLSHLSGSATRPLRTPGAA